MVQVEVCITYVPIKPNTIEVINPKHLLFVGRVSGDPLFTNISDDDLLNTKRWR